MTLRTFGVSFIVAAATISGCATGHATMRGSVVMKIDPTTAHVCLGNGEVAVNDHVRLFRNICKQGGAGSGASVSVCTKEKVADGTVTQLLDDHYSVVTFPTGTTFEEGNTIEKL